MTHPLRKLVREKQLHTQDTADRENVKKKIELWDVLRILVPLLVAAYLFQQAMLDGLDLRVYWAGARELATGGDLYAPGLPGTPYGGMAFTYPPFAAAIMAPMAFLPADVALAIQTVSNLVIAGVLGAGITRYLMVKGAVRVPPRAAQWWLTSAFVAGLMLLLGPWRNSLALGQINPLLMLLIAADLLGSTRRRPNGLLPRGILSGIAAGIKLTPLVFLLYFVVRKDFRGAARMAASFAATVGLMVLMAPDLSLRYWLTALRDTSRVGTLSRFENISLRGFIARLHVDESLGNVLWIGASLAVIALGAVIVYRLRSAPDQWEAVSATALVMLLISPVSWSHHWVWVALVVPVIIGRAVPAGSEAGCSDAFRWLRFLRSWPGVLAVLTVAAFSLQPPEAAKLSGSLEPYAAISAFSELVAESGMFAAVLLLVWFAVSRSGSLRSNPRALPEPDPTVL
ncbi:glycosyltransferase 87 family protein [Arthrobacter sp. 92]|uniref:glycosyltransferase 87 family protein n=1 Tax=Arthrobacter sp. 92 TaxID=3418175 RepID=UPI003D08E631